MQKPTERQHRKDLLFVEPQPEAPFLIKSKPDFRKVERSSLLKQVESFLPVMKKANEELLEKIRTEGEESVNIEVVDENKEHIEMKLGWLSDSESEESGNDEERSEGEEGSEGDSLSDSGDREPTSQ